MKSRELLGLLADGQIHSGQSIAESLNVSRTAVWKQVRRASEEGYAIDTVRGKGYRLITPVDLLDADAILNQLGPGLTSNLSLQIYDEVDSTNAEIIRQRANRKDGRTLVCLADHQSAGRGRRGRAWQSPPGENLYISFGLTFRGGFAMLDGLSLALGLSVATALEKQGVSGVGLKWPNDIYVNRSKLSGILVELQGELEEGVVKVVAGIGINVHMSSSDKVDQAWTSLVKAEPGRPWQRNQVAVGIIKSVMHVSEAFAAKGFADFREQWQARDIFRDQMLATVDGQLLGLGCGIDEQGNYLVERSGKIQRVRAGEISLRARS